MGDAHELRHHGKPASAYTLEQRSFNEPKGVSCYDYVAAVFACEGCRVFHAAVLHPPAQAEEPWDDNNPPKPASGCEGEGAE